jgi:hypothetical protein
MRTTKYPFAALYTVTQDPAVAMRAFGSHREDGAFKTIEYVFVVLYSNGEGLIVVVSAHFTTSHDNPLRLAWMWRTTRGFAPGSQIDHQP